MDWTELANIATTIGVPLTALGLVLVLVQVRRASITSKAQFLHDLEQDARSINPLFEHIRPEADSIPSDEKELRELRVLLFSALDFFEKVQLLHRNGAIDIKSLNALFAGRFFLLIHSEWVQSEVLLNENYSEYWPSLWQLYKEMTRFRRRRSLPIYNEKNRIDHILNDG